MISSVTFDQSFCRRTLERVVWRRDFQHVAKAEQNAFRETLLANALQSATGCFAPSNQLLTSFPLHGKIVYRLIQTPDELVVRKLQMNLKQCSPAALEGRSQIVRNLRLLLEEGVPYRVYRLDIRSFFESFDRQHVLHLVNSLCTLSPQSKLLIAALFKRHADLGGTGLPRGLALSAALSELLMRDFDRKVRWANDTFFFARYVDDIIIVTSAREIVSDFLKNIQSWLPCGLTLNHQKKSIVDTAGKVSKVDAPCINRLLAFNYLGYKFDVSNPTKLVARNISDGKLFRKVIVDITEKKIKKIKTRIIRSLMDFLKTGDWPLLKDRIVFLTQNFSVYNPKAGGKKVAGIYFSYPLATLESPGLRNLDSFLRNAVLGKQGRIFARTSTLLTGKRRRELLGYSFVRGHTDRSFVHFSSQRISNIQKCWTN